MHLVAIPSMLALLQGQPEPPVYDKVAVVVIAAACLIGVGVTVLYPWSWRILGLGLILFLSGSWLLFGSIMASIFPAIGETFVAFRWTETAWMMRGLLVGGALLIIAGCAERLVTRWPGWKAAGRRFAVFVVIGGVVRLAVEIVHRVRS